MLKRAVYLVIFLSISLSAEAQINLYMGGNVQGNYTWIRGDEPSYNPGFGGGFSFVYWEYEYWFIKAGIDYHHKSSSIMDYPDIFDVEPLDPDDKIRIGYSEHAVGIPLTFYFRPYERGENALLLTGTLETIGVASLKADSEEYGELVLPASGARTFVKTNIGLGIGYQRQLEKHTFLNFVASYNMDVRGTPSFNCISLTAELIFGVY
jgi:hypothetical protein